MSKKGSLVIISGFSGAGKGTVVKELMKNYECYALSISATTRNPRPGEENGREYFFKTKEEFEELIRQDALYEYAQYVDILLKVQIAYYIVIFLISILVSKKLLNKRIGL